MSNKELKKQWNNEIFLALFDNYTECDYKGYNNIKPLFKQGYIMNFQIAKNIFIEVKSEDLDFLSLEYIDGWHIISDIYETNTIENHFSSICNSKNFIALRNYVINFYSELVNNLSLFIYESEINENYIDNDIIKDFINLIIKEKLN